MISVKMVILFLEFSSWRESRTQKSKYLNILCSFSRKLLLHQISKSPAFFQIPPFFIPYINTASDFPNFQANSSTSSQSPSNP